LPREIGGHNQVSYAHSSISGQESVITVPISIGEDPVTAGIDHVDIFLDSRDDGRKLLAQPGVGAGNMWHATVDLPSNQGGLHTLFFYVHSAVSGQTAVVSVPVEIEP
jgi:hypothetical protein